jgi:hypothetical protein
MLVRIDPPILGQKYGLGALNIDHLILSARLAGRSLYPIKEWPCHVYVMRIVNDQILKTLFLGKADVQMISWGTLHRTFEEAAAVVSALVEPSTPPK